MSTQIPNPGPFAGHFIGLDGPLYTNSSKSLLVTSDPRLIACWAFAAWSHRIESNRRNDERAANEARKNADICLVMAKGEK